MSLQFFHVWKICILKKQATDAVLVGWFSKHQSIKKVGRRRFAEGLYQALFSFRLAHRNVIYKAKRKLSLISGQEFHNVLMEFQFLISKTQDRTFLQTFKVRIQVLWCKKNTASHKKVHIPDWKLMAHTWLSSLDPCPHDAVGERSVLKPSLLFLILYPA